MHTVKPVTYSFCMCNKDGRVVELSALNLNIFVPVLEAK